MINVVGKMVSVLAVVVMEQNVMAVLRSAQPVLWREKNRSFLFR
jgi:hypothetical protein